MTVIWILEDHPEIGPLLVSVLRGPEGLRVSLFDSGEAALAAAEADGAPDIVYYHHLSGQPTGPEVIEALRRRNPAFRAHQVFGTLPLEHLRYRATRLSM